MFSVYVCIIPTGARRQGHAAGAGPTLASGQPTSARGEPDGSRPAQEVHRLVPPLSRQKTLSCTTYIYTHTHPHTLTHTHTHRFTITWLTPHTN